MLYLWNVLLALLWPLLHFYRPFRGTVPDRLGQGLPDWSSSGGTLVAGQHVGDRVAAAARFLINAVSAGEVVAIAPFIRELKSRLPDCRIALLTTTDSGQEMARAKLGDVLDLLAYFPLADLPFAVRRYLDRLRPSVYITTESELWPNIQIQCRARGIPVVSLNARVYLHNKRGWRGALVKRLYSLCDLIVCQSAEHLSNFVKLGIRQDKLVLSGNTKFDFTLPDWTPQQLANWRAQHRLPPAAPCIVAGSTHSGEEELLLAVLKYLPQHGHEPHQPANQSVGLEQTRLILAPRHIERAGEAVELARKAGFTASTLAEAETNAEQQPAPRVLVVDRYGVLVDFYRLADLVVMGGTFHPKIGGHNLLEATALGKPVVIGPSTFGITAQVELLDTHSAVVHGLQDGGELTACIRRLLTDPQQAHAIGRRAQAATLASRGASKRAADAVLALLGL